MLVASSSGLLVLTRARVHCAEIHSITVSLGVGEHNSWRGKKDAEKWWRRRNGAAGDGMLRRAVIVTNWDLLSGRGRADL